MHNYEELTIKKLIINPLIAVLGESKNTNIQYDILSHSKKNKIVILTNNEKNEIIQNDKILIDLFEKHEFEYNKFGENLNNSIVLIYDYEKKVIDMELFFKLMYNGRNYKISNIVMSKTLTIPPGARENFDYFFIFYNDDEKYIKKVYELPTGAR